MTIGRGVLGGATGRVPGGLRYTRRSPVLGFIALLLVVWLALSIVGAVVEGLFWLLIVGVILFVLTAAVGWTRRRTGV
ncbi:hypothetical protein [Trujillonella humicola]|uniref:hypothetical protein n=1 Tax=Trujillonella humicola TaxID=3383699 RepID=UPI003906A16C